MNALNCIVGRQRYGSISPAWICRITECNINYYTCCSKQVNNIASQNTGQKIYPTNAEGSIVYPRFLDVYPVIAIKYFETSRCSLFPDRGNFIRHYSDTVVVHSGYPMTSGDIMGTRVGNIFKSVSGVWIESMLLIQRAQ